MALCCWTLFDIKSSGIINHKKDNKWLHLFIMYCIELQILGSNQLIAAGTGDQVLAGRRAYFCNKM